MENVTTTDELVAMVKATLRPYGLVHVDQVLAWLQRQADITRAECANEYLDKCGYLGLVCDFSVADEFEVLEGGRQWNTFCNSE